MDLLSIAQQRFKLSIDLPLAFFEAEAEKVSLACLAMARRFHQNGRLLAFGAGNCITDAQHISVEFVHPVIVGKRALPAIAIGTDIAATIGLAESTGWHSVYAGQISAIGKKIDIAIGIDSTGTEPAVIAGLNMAQHLGLLTIGLSGGIAFATNQPLDFSFVVRSQDTAVVQEIHESLYHILWELVHVFFEHQGILGKEIVHDDLA